MKTQLAKIKELKENISSAVLFDDTARLLQVFLNSTEKEYLEKKLENEEEAVIFRYPDVMFFRKIKEGKIPVSEAMRQAGARFYEILKKEKIELAQILNLSHSEFILPFIEGLLLTSYTFPKYKKDKDDYRLNEILVLDPAISDKELKEAVIVSESVFFARNLVNEPLSYLTAKRLSEEIEKAGKAAGFSTEIFENQKIKSLKMGGLLAVNKGSIDPPTFTVIEWKPENLVNEKPVVLVGKGVVYDTGGLSLKPTPNSMDYMKSDMGGAAAVAATVYALAKTNTPVHVVGLIPATDNRPDGNAYVPGDVITISDGTTVEINNTDAEGRLLLADALTYAKKYKPALVIDIATLTGTSVLITGISGIVAMGNSPENMQKLKQSGEQVYERIIELPLWEEFSEPLKSPIADLNNLGTREGQASIAGKFLEHFTGYPWIHLDIAGAAFISENKDYRIKGGTGVGTRLLFNFLKNLEATNTETT